MLQESTSKAAPEKGVYVLFGQSFTKNGIAIAVICTTGVVVCTAFIALLVYFVVKANKKTRDGSELKERTTLQEKIVCNGMQYPDMYDFKETRVV